MREEVTLTVLQLVWQLPAKKQTIRSVNTTTCIEKQGRQFQHLTSGDGEVLGEVFGEVFGDFDVDFGSVCLDD